MPLVFGTLKTSKKDFHRSQHQKRKDEIRPFSILADFNPLLFTPLQLTKSQKKVDKEVGLYPPFCGLVVIRYEAIRLGLS